MSTRGRPVLEDAAKKYANLKQGTGTNALMQTGNKSFEVDKVTGKGKAIINGVLITVEDIAKRKLNVQALKIFNLMVVKLTEHFPHGGNPRLEEIDKRREITFTVDEYMKICNLSDVKRAREAIREGVNALYGASLSWEETYKTSNNKLKTKKYNMRIITSVGEETTFNTEGLIENGCIKLKFDIDMAKYFVHAPVMPYPLELMKINSNDHPHAFYLGYKLAHYHNLNIEKGDRYRISVKKLVEVCPALPTQDALKDSRQERQRIITPFERDMDALTEAPHPILKEWTYCRSGGEPLTDEELNRMPYRDWINLLVEFEFSDYPDQTERLEKTAHKIKRNEKDKLKRKAIKEATWEYLKAQEASKEGQDSAQQEQRAEPQPGQSMELDALIARRQAEARAASQSSQSEGTATDQDS